MLSEVNSQLVICSDVVLLHPYLDGLSFSPAVSIDFVSSKVHVIINKSRVHVFQHANDHFPGQVQGRIELALIDSITIQAYVLVFLASSPGFRVSWCIDLRNDSNASSSSIGNDRFYINFTVHTTNTATLAELWQRRYEKRKSIFVSDMPMEYVEFGVHHSIDCMLQRGNRHEVPRGVDHKSSPEIGRCIGNGDRKPKNLVLFLGIPFEQLRKGLKPSQKSRIIICIELPFTSFPDKYVVLFMFKISGNKWIHTLYRHIQDNLTRLYLAALEDLNKIEVDDFLNIYLPRRTDRILDVAWRNSDVRPLRCEGKVHGFGPKLA